MAITDPAIDVLAGFVSGVTLELGALAAMPGARLVELDARGAYALDGHREQSVDSIISRGGLEHALDTLGTLAGCRRILRDGGRLALVIADGADPNTWSDAPHAFTIDTLTRTLATVGGFEVVRAAELAGEGASLVVAERRACLDVRSVFGMHAQALADAAQRRPEQRAELLFQIGTILLRAGDGSIARRCYEALHELAPDHADCAFGLGMCHASERSWSAAVTWLRTAAELDPSNHEARRWLGLAQLELDSNGHGLGPQGARS
jgi:hypothetical protein